MAGIAAWISARNPAKNQPQLAKALGTKEIMGHTLGPETGQAASHSLTNIGIGIPHGFRDGGNCSLDFGLEPCYNPASVCYRASVGLQNGHPLLQDKTGS
jgi:hypothetical protein